MKKRIVALGLILTMLLGTMTVYGESKEVHESEPYTRNKEPNSGGYTSSYQPTINFLKCIGSTSNSLTFAMGASYVKTKNGNQELVRPDGIHFECTDLTDRTTKVESGNWSPSSLNKIDIALGSKAIYTNNNKKVEYKKQTMLVKGITGNGKISSGYTISNLTPGHKYSIKVTVWNKGSNDLIHYIDNNKVKCTYFDTWDTTPYKAEVTATVSTAPKKGDLGVESISTRYTKIDATEQTVYVGWNRNTGIDKYGYIVQYVNSKGELSEYTGNQKSNKENPSISGNATGAYIKVPSNKVSKVIVYSTGSVYGLHKITNTVGSTKQKASYYDWYLAPQTDKASAKAIEVIPQVQVKTAQNSGNKIKVTWSKISGLSNTDKYVVYCCSTANNVKSFKKIATVGSDKTSYTFEKVGNSKIDSKKNYYVYVVAVDSNVDLPEDDLDINVESKSEKSLVNYIYRATKTGKPNLLGKR